MLKKQVMSFNAPTAKGPYSCAVKIGDFVYISGVLPKVPETNELAGNDIFTQTQQVMKNIEGILGEMDLSTYNIVKTTIFMRNLNDFDDMDKAYGTFFKEPFPARSCVEVSNLQNDALVQIECFVVDTLKYELNEDPCKGCAEYCED
jgi:2-iminobutanoate/2-iminopropanoate deaminase